MQISKRLMNGMVLMYAGDSIPNYDGQSSDHITTLGLKYWYCMNGLSGQPDMRNKFARCESTAGNIGGHDDDQVVAHTHSTTGSGSSNHHHYLSSVSNHSHVSIVECITFSSGTRGDFWDGHLRSTNLWDLTDAGAHTHDDTGSGGNHSHTLQDVGGSLSGRNMPDYKSLNFIRRSR